MVHLRAFVSEVTPAPDTLSRVDEEPAPQPKGFPRSAGEALPLKYTYGVVFLPLRVILSMYTLAVATERSVAFPENSNANPLILSVSKVVLPEIPAHPVLLNPFLLSQLFGSSTSGISTVAQPDIAAPNLGAVNE